MEQIKISNLHQGRQVIVTTIIRALISQAFSQLTDEDYKFWEAENPSLEIGEFFNCREEGFTYSLLGGKQDMVFCVYEHRNSDQIIINGCKREDMAAYGPYNGDSKYSYLASFGYDEYHEAADKLVEFLLQAYKGEFDESILKPVEKEA